MAQSEYIVTHKKKNKRELTEIPKPMKDIHNAAIQKPDGE